MDPCVSQGEISEAIQLGKSAHHRIDEHKDRIDKLEENNKILHEMNTNIKLLVQQNGYRDRKVDGIEENVKFVSNEVLAIREKPLIVLNKIVWIVATVIVTALTTAIIVSLPTIISNLGK